MHVVFRCWLAVLLLCLVGLPARAAELEKPRLLVLVVFDQMRGDYLPRWRAHFGEGGFTRLLKDGAWFPNCHYPYANTQTGPGHASMLTGCCPDQHGIVMNQWYDRKTAAVVNCAESGRYQRVPALQKAASDEPDLEKMNEEGPVKAKGKFAGSPEHILAPTIGDVLKEATDGKAKVVGLSFKDRSALLPVGKSADAVYWLDSADGMIVTSSVYRDSVHPWVADFNKARIADQWFAKDWTRLRGDLDYEKIVGPDQVAGEGKGIKQGYTFPHPTDGGLPKPGRSYYEALFNSPFGNDMLLELTKRAIVAEKLGSDEVTDLLVVSFSSNDAIGHCWGPDSQEVFDVTLRSDRTMAELLGFLDKQVGPGKYLLALTADHGICPLPEVSAAKGLFAKRLPGRKYITGLEDHLRAKFDGAPVDPDTKSRWVESAQAPWIYLNEALIAARGLKSAVVAKEAAEYLAKQEGIMRTYTRADLAGEFPDNDPIGQRVKRSYYPERCGDVVYVLCPYCLMDPSLTGTNHGTPHDYDTHVPLLFFGGGVKSGDRPGAITPQSIAAVFAKAAGIPTPKKAAFAAPDDLFLVK
jgi:predicted AlkP superfamily pyrophosphatase or phosphodiesterase